MLGCEGKVKKCQERCGGCQERCGGGEERCGERCGGVEKCGESVRSEWESVLGSGKK